MAEGRILAVKLDGKLFDKLDELVEQEGITKQKYMTELISRDISQRMQQKETQEKELDIKHTDGTKTWDRVEVMDATIMLMVISMKTMERYIHSESLMKICSLKELMEKKCLLYLNLWERICQMLHPKEVHL